MFRLSKRINILQFYCKYWNPRRKFDESLCKEVNHNWSLRKIYRTNHQCATYNYASHGLNDKYFRCWCESRNCMNQGFLTKNIVKQTLEYFKISNEKISSKLESKFFCFGLKYKKWKNCFKISICNFNIFTFGDEVYLNRVIYLKYLTITESNL
jgi:hypothetical protein